MKKSLLFEIGGVAAIALNATSIILKQNLNIVTFGKATEVMVCFRNDKNTNVKERSFY